MFFNRWDAYVSNLIATFVKINDIFLEMKTSTHLSLPLSDVLNRLSQRRWVLPSFQRDFVWTMEQIENLFNSIRLGYPFGALLSWHVNLGVNNHNLQDEDFYSLIQYYHEDKSKSNIIQNKVSLLSNNEYWNQPFGNYCPRTCGLPHHV